MSRLVALVLLFTVSASCLSAETFLGRSVEITDGRSDRTKSAPLIVAMHGFLGTSRSMRRKAGFDALAKRHGFIVAYPNGIRRRWNDGRSADNRVDDVGYLAELIRSLVGDGRVDPARVFLAGHSNGGGMAMRFACDRPDLTAGIAVVATKTPTSYQCRKGRPVPAIFFHGTSDPIAPHQGRPQSSRLGGTLSAVDTLKLWAARNRCRGIARTQTIDRRNDGTSADLTAYAGCRAALWYVLITGHGHDWPGNGRGATRLQGPATKEVAAGQLSWRFFERL